MKKLMISMAAAMLASVSLANASTIFSNNPSTAVVYTQEKTEIKPEELPDAVKSALGAEPYNEWQVQKAYLVPAADGTPLYEIDLSKGEEAQTVRFSQDGRVIE